MIRYIQSKTNGQFEAIVRRMDGASPATLEHGYGRQRDTKSRGAAISINGATLTRIEDSYLVYKEL